MLNIRETFSLRQVLQFLGILLLCTVLVCYILFQARNMLKGPTLALTNIPDSPAQTERVIISGTAHNIVKLTLNGKEIHTDKEGIFTHELVLEKGYTIATLWAQDRFGRTTTLSRDFVYIAPSTTTSSSTRDTV